MHEGRVAIKNSLSVNDYDLVTPSVDIHTVGAGGGTIAGIDLSGLMYAGPEGAGALPGPAAYGLGGTFPTVTDAHLVLGRLRPGPYADGSIELDIAAAEKAINREIAKPLGISCTDAASGIIRIVEQNLLHAVERISIQRGYNPGRFMLIACGGAGPMHGSRVGRLLGAKAVYVPRQAGAFCAIGMQHADVRRDFVLVIMSVLEDGATSIIRDGYKHLEEQARLALASEGFMESETTFEYGLDLHYEGQQWDVNLDLSRAAKPKDIRAAFEVEYDRQFGHTNPDGRINVSKIRVVGVGRLLPLAEPVYSFVNKTVNPFETRSVYYETLETFIDTPIYLGSDLNHGQVLKGPAIIEEATTTILASPGDIVTVDHLNNYIITVSYTHLTLPTKA